MNNARLVRAANRWRDHYNPLRGLYISRVVELLEAGERGEFADLQWLYKFVEKRFPVLRSGIVRRRASLEKLTHSIKVMDPLPDGATKTMAEAQRKHLQGRYNLITNLTDAIARLALAEFRGYCHLQKHRYDGGPNDGAVRELHWLPQWNWVRDGQFGSWFWNEKAQSGANARTLADHIIDPSDFIIREVDMPINEIASIAFVNSSMGKKDWAAFVEIFGIPGCIIEMPGNIPDGKEPEYQTSAERVAEGASGAVPAGTKPHFPTQGIRGSAPFKEFLDAEKEDVVLAMTGGKLAMLNEATGIGGSQGDHHADAFDELAQGEARQISEIFQKQFDLPELNEAFPSQPICVYFDLAPVDEDDAKDLAECAATWSRAGYETDEKEMSERSGLKLTRKQPVTPGKPPMPGQPVERPPQPVRNRAAADTQDLADLLALDLGVPADWLAPVEDLLREMDRRLQDGALSDEELITFLENATQRIPDLFMRMDVAGLADTFEAAMGGAAMAAARESVTRQLKAGKEVPA